MIANMWTAATSLAQSPLIQFLALVAALVFGTEFAIRFHRAVRAEFKRAAGVIDDMSLPRRAEQ